MLIGRRGFVRASGVGLAAAAAVGTGRRAMAAGPFEVQTQKHRVRVTPLVEGLDHPWGIDFLPDGSGFLVTERAGRLRLFSGGSLGPPLGGLPPLVVGARAACSTWPCTRPSPPTGWST